MIEDEKNLADLLRGYLEREGLEVHQAFDGEAGLEAARRMEPDMIVLYWMLPGLDGMEVLRELRRFSEAYVIMLTARTEEVDRIVGLSTGADAYLTKPFSPESSSPAYGQCSAGRALERRMFQKRSRSCLGI